VSAEWVSMKLYSSPTPKWRFFIGALLEYVLVAECIKPLLH